MATQREEQIPPLRVGIKELLESGAHFGHQTHRWNPKMKPFIFEKRNGIHIINLAKTMEQIRACVQCIRNEIVSRRKSVLFVGTKKQAKIPIKECAELAGEFYVCERWLGGMLTNLPTIRRSVKTLGDLEKRLAGSGEGFTKKELSLMTKEQIKLNRDLSGVIGMRKLPGLLIVVGEEPIAIREANKLGIPIIALIDTNSDPDLVDYPVACNDDAIKCIRLVLQEFAQAILDRKQEMNLALEEEALEKEFAQGDLGNGEEVSP